MTPVMLANPAVGRNLARLREDGWDVLEPDEGLMACGDEGRGRHLQALRYAEVANAALGAHDELTLRKPGLYA